MGAQATISVAKYDDVDEHQLSVGTSLVPFPAPREGFGLAIENIFIQALPTNSGTITVATTNANPTAGGAATAILSAGQNINLPINQYTRWQAIGSGGTQVLNIVYAKGGS